MTNLQGLAGERGLFQKPGDITNLFLEEEGPGSREFFGELFADRRTAKIDGAESKYDVCEYGVSIGFAWIFFEVGLANINPMVTAGWSWQEGRAVVA